MALATDIITTERLRSAIGEVGDENDTLIEAYRATAIDWMENYTARAILDRAYTSDPSEFGVFNGGGAYSSRGEYSGNISGARTSYSPDYIFWRVTDIKAGDIVINYSAANDDPMGQPGATPLTIATTDRRVHLTQDAVAIYSRPTDDEWCNVMRFDHPVPTISVQRGMDRDDIPPSWGDACALIVRALMDGSAYDDLSSMSVLKYILKPYYTGVYMRTQRR